ncbi:MAG: hypothetical protein PVJ67_06455, partial [Candidatus Pacearchaeota archaeon]|jgi:hypothetical protein
MEFKEINNDEGKLAGYYVLGRDASDCVQFDLYDKDKNIVSKNISCLTLNQSMVWNIDDIEKYGLEKLANLP